VQFLADTTGEPLRTSPVEPGSAAGITAARRHVLPQLRPATGNDPVAPADARYDGDDMELLKITNWGGHMRRSGPATVPASPCRPGGQCQITKVRHRGTARVPGALGGWVTQGMQVRRVLITGR